MPGGSPNATASFRYDGEGERVAQQSTSSGVTTTTRYLLGGLEELTTVGSTTTLTKYYSVPGVVTAVKVGTTLSYLATDGLGSVSVALSVAGSTTGQALYLPYGAGRYSSGSMPTARGYTGQYQDSTSGLDYYGARYYDPVLSQFTSADTVQAGGLNRYAYVGDNPTSATDPSGHFTATDAERGPAETEVAPAAAAGTVAAAGAAAASGFNWLNVLRPFAIAGLAGLAWQAWSQPPRPTSLPTPDVVGSSGPAIHMGSPGWRPTTKPTPTTPHKPHKPTGGGSSGGGGQGGDGTGPQPPPATSSGSQESWAPDEPAPEPSTDGAMQGGGRRCSDLVVSYIASCLGAWQYGYLGGKGRGNPCGGACVIQGTLGGAQVGITLGFYTGTDPVANHAETQEYQDVLDILLAFALPGDVLSIDFINEYKACTRYCGPNITSGLWNSNLQIAAGPGVQLTINWWWHHDDGTLSAM